MSSEVPVMTRAQLLARPLPRHTDATGASLIKKVALDGETYLIARSVSDIANEYFGVLGVRPMVYMDEPDEALEKAVWCYAQNRLPVIAERIPEVAHAAAAFYHIDSMICDRGGLALAAPYLRGRSEPLQYLNIVGYGIDPRELEPMSVFAREVRMIMALPEVGAFAATQLSVAPRYRALPGCSIEKDGAHMVLTRSASSGRIIRVALPETTVEFDV